MSSFDTLPPLSLYIHFPWCVRKCPYCDFYSHETSSILPEEEYLIALQQDLVAALELISEREISSIFIGGGTPSLMSAEGIEEFLTFIQTLIPLAPDAEITLEANPGTFESDKFQSYRHSGINRLSIGIQSFNPKHLETLGRIHSAEEAKKAIEIAQKHFDNINLDLMYALPSQTVEEMKQDIETAIAFKPQHLSLYQLTIELNTYFAKNPPTLPDDDTVADMQDLIEEMTANAGYEHYEVSAYAQADRKCRHNLNYWLFGDYLGIGAGAHSKITTPDGQVHRQMRYKQPKIYMEQAGNGTAVQENIICTPQDLGFEFMLNALRLPNGFSPDLFRQRTGISLDIIQKNLDEAEKKGLLYCDETVIKPTEKGWLFLNDLQQIFLPD